MKLDLRLEFIILKVFWEGSVSRLDLMKAFPIASTQASKDFASLKTQYPGALIYDPSKRRYVAGRSLSRITKSYSFDDYQRIVGQYNPNRHLIDASRVSVEPEIYRLVNTAINRECGIEVTYSSMNNPTPPVGRVLYPHSVIKSGFRWHIRAYDKQSKSFRDFNLTRIQEVIRIVEDNCMEASPRLDEAWNNLVTLILIPNMGLSIPQQKIIARDYTGKEDLDITVKVRQAELIYILHLYEVRDFSSSPPATQLLQIGNLSELKVYLP